MAQPPPLQQDSGFQRNRIQEALQVFSDLQTAKIADASDVDRIRATSASGTRNTPRSGTTPRESKVSTKQQESLTQMKHKVDVSDAIMKKLHKKNQDLVAEVDRLKQGIENGTGHQQLGRPGSAASKQVIASLRSDVHQRDQELQDLKTRLLNMSAESSKGATTADPSNAELQLLQQRYDELLGVNMRLVDQGESTGKINKEVKLFFSALKHRLAHEVQMRVVEQQLMNERQLALEERLCERETRHHR